LKTTARAVAPGDSLPVTGEKFGGASRLELVLVGVAGRFEMASVRADTAGAFHATLAVPDTLPPGDYRLVAVATDGDEVAGLDLSVHARAQVAEPDAHATDEHHDMAGAPSAEPLALERARSPWVTGSAVAFAGLALIAGLILVRRPRGGEA
jgi:hypothetical protein